jgi:hypothetical protein
MERQVEALLMLDRVKQSHDIIEMEMALNAVRRTPVCV